MFCICDCLIIVYLVLVCWLIIDLVLLFLVVFFGCFCCLCRLVILLGTVFGVCYSFFLLVCCFGSIV